MSGALLLRRGAAIFAIHDVPGSRVEANRVTDVSASPAHPRGMGMTKMTRGSDSRSRTVGRKLSHYKSPRHSCDATCHGNFTFQVSESRRVSARHFHKIFLELRCFCSVQVEQATDVGAARPALQLRSCCDLELRGESSSGKLRDSLSNQSAGAEVDLLEGIMEELCSKA